MSEHSTTTASPTRTEAELRTLMARAVREVRETNPLAPSITNTVTQSFVANAQLAVGGSAAMVYLPDEGECVAALGGAVYINLGTLMPVYEQTVPATARACAAAATPWVLDPVGVGIGSLRHSAHRGRARESADHFARQRLGDHRRGRPVGAWRQLGRWRFRRRPPRRR